MARIREWLDDDRSGDFPKVCEIHCTVCEGADHHWLPDCDEETGEPLNVCKHCDAVRPYQDEDGES